MRILGIDPGYDRVGWAVVECDARKNCVVIAYDCIQTSNKATTWQRYSQIIDSLKTAITEHKPTAAAIESIFFSNNQKTAIRVSEARGVIIATLLPHIAVVSEYTPNQIKLAVTGYGNSDKAAVEKMVRLQLKLNSTTVIDDTIDAVATAFTHALLQGAH